MESTLFEANIAPENGWLEYVIISFWDGLFSEPMLVFPPPMLKHMLVKLDHPRISMGTLPCLKKQVDFSFTHIKVSIHWMIAISQNAARLTLRYFSKGSMMSKKSTVNLIWLVVSTHLKNISQIGSFLQSSGWKSKNVWNHHLVMQRFFWSTSSAFGIPTDPGDVSRETPQAPRDFREASRARSTGNMTEKRLFFQALEAKRSCKICKQGSWSFSSFFSRTNNKTLTQPSQSLVCTPKTKKRVLFGEMSD